MKLGNYILAFFLGNIFNIFCDPNLKTRHIEILDLDLINIDAEKFDIVKSSGDQEAYKITVKDNNKVNSIKVKNKLLWSRKKSECEGVTIFKIEDHLLLILNTTEKGIKHNLHYFKDENFYSIGVMEFLELINNKFKNSESHITLNISDEYSKVFYDYTEKHHNDLEYESYKYDDEYGIIKIIDDPINIDTGVINTYDEESTHDESTTTTPNYDTKTENIDKKLIWKSSEKNKFAKKVEIYKKDRKYMLMSIQLNDDGYEYLEYKGDNIDVVNGWEVITEKEFDMIVGSTGMKLFKTMSNNRFKIKSGKIVKEKLYDDVIDLNKRNLFCEYTNNNISNNLFVSIKPNKPDNLKKIVFSHKEVNTDKAEEQRSTFESEDENYKKSENKEITLENSTDSIKNESNVSDGENSTVDLIYEFKKPMKDYEQFSEVIIIYTKLSNNSHYVEVISDKKADRINNMYFKYNPEHLHNENNTKKDKGTHQSTRWVLDENDQWVKSDQSNNKWKKISESEYLKSITDHIKKSVNYLENFDVAGIESGTQIKELPNHIKTIMEVSQNPKPVQSANNKLNDDQSNCSNKETSGVSGNDMDKKTDSIIGKDDKEVEVDVTVIPDEKVEVNPNEESKEIEESLEGQTIKIKYVGEVEEEENSFWVSGIIMNLVISLSILILI